MSARRVVEAAPGDDRWAAERSVLDRMPSLESQQVQSRRAFLTRGCGVGALICIIVGAVVLGAVATNPVVRDRKGGEHAAASPPLPAVTSSAATASSSTMPATAEAVAPRAAASVWGAAQPTVVTASAPVTRPAVAAAALIAAAAPIPLHIAAPAKVPWTRFPHTIVYGPLADSLRVYFRPGAGAESDLLAEAMVWAKEHPGEVAVMNIATNWGVQGYSPAALDHLLDSPKAGSWTAFVAPDAKSLPTAAPTVFTPLAPILHPLVGGSHGAFAPALAFASTHAQFGDDTWWREMIATSRPRVLRIKAGGGTGFGNRVRAMASHVLAAYLLGRAAVVEGMPILTEFWERPQGPGLQWVPESNTCASQHRDAFYQTVGPPEEGGPGGQSGPKWGGLFELSTKVTRQWESKSYRAAVEKQPYLCFQTGGPFCVKGMLKHAAGTTPSTLDAEMLVRQKAVFGARPPYLMNMYHAAISWMLARPTARLKTAVADFKRATNWTRYKLRVTTHVRTCIGDSCGASRVWSKARLVAFRDCVLRWIGREIAKRGIKASDVLLFVANDAPHTVVPIFSIPLRINGGESIAFASVSNAKSKRRDEGGSGLLPIALDWYMLGEGEVFFLNAESTFSQTAFARSTSVESAVLFGGPPHAMLCALPRFTHDEVAAAMEPPSQWDKQLC